MRRALLTLQKSPIAGGDKIDYCMGVTNTLTVNHLILQGSLPLRQARHTIDKTEIVKLLGEIFESTF